MAYEVNFNNEEKLDKAIAQIFVGLVALSGCDSDKLKEILDNVTTNKCCDQINDAVTHKLKEDLAISTANCYKSAAIVDQEIKKEDNNGIQRNI